MRPRANLHAALEACHAGSQYPCDFQGITSLFGTDVDVDPTALSLRALVEPAANAIKEEVVTTAETDQTIPLIPIKLSTRRDCGVVRIIENGAVRATA